MKKPSLFISYSHSPPEHKAKVQALIATLTTHDEFEVIHDHAVTEPQGPPEGWMTWMSQQVTQADWVLVVCNEGYLASWGKRPDAGRGVAYEANFLRQQLYDDRMVNNKLIPVIVAEPDRAFIPTELADSTSYHLPTEIDLLLPRILESTWLGRFISGLGSHTEEEGSAPLSSSDIMQDAAQLDVLSDELPAIAILRDQLISEANEHWTQLAGLDGALAIQKQRLSFQKSFCPRMKELFEITEGNIPESLEKIYERECLS